MSDETAIEALVKGTLDRFGQLDAAFNNAGITGAFAPVSELPAAEFDRVMSVNARGVWLMIKHEVKAMLAHGRGGAIVNTSSIAATGGSVGLSIYAASKAALEAMVRVVALEVGSEGIRINNVSPGVIKTPMSMRYGEEALAAYGAHAPLKRLGEPEDVGDVVAWLCSSEARSSPGRASRWMAASTSLEPGSRMFPLGRVAIWQYFRLRWQSSRRRHR